jgi:hypothetical protein
LSSPWEPWSEWITRLAGGVALADGHAERALVTSAALCDESIDQPTTLRESTSSTTAQ